MIMKYTVYLKEFWDGFSSKSDKNLPFLENVLRSAFYPSEVEFTNDINLANVLFESVFHPSLINYKNWLYKFQYSGEPWHHNLSNYDLTFVSEQDSKNVVDVPLSAFYINSNKDYLDRLMNRPIRTTVPNKFCCFIVSNGNCAYRNKMFHMLSKYKKVDSWGNFQNNMGYVLPYHFSSQEFVDFISNYKFIICFENTKIGTYSTEKILNAYLANIVPVYWSSHHIKNIFNIDSILFLENEEERTYINLINRIIELDNNDQKYLEFVNRPVFKDMTYWNENYTFDRVVNKVKSRLTKQYNFQFFITHYTPLVERKNHIINELRKAGIEEYTFIETKDRDVLTPEEVSKFTQITKSEISLFLKHVEVFKLDINDKYVVVLEDDAILCENFCENLTNYIYQLQSERWDVLFPAECCDLHCNVDQGKNVKQTNSSRGTCMYVLNYGAGKRLYEIFNGDDNVHQPIDWWMNYATKSNDVVYFWSEPTLVSQGSSTGLFSTSLRFE